MTDFSKLSTEDLQSYVNGDMSKVSTEGLKLITSSESTSEANPYEATFREALQNIPQGKRVMGGMLGGLTGETIKNIGAATELVSPKYGKPIAQVGQAMTNVSKEASPYNIDYVPTPATIGAIGSYFAPTSVINKGGELLAASSTMPKLAKALTNLGGNMGLGFLTTEGTGQEGLVDRAKSAALAGGVTLGLPIVGAAVNKAYQGGKAMLEPFYEKGQEAIIARALRNFSGGQSDEAITNLLASTPTVKGSLPTVGQASGVPSLAATERALLNASPEATNMLTNRQTQNALARTRALENIAPSSRVEKYTNLRTKLSEDLYEPALQKGMDFATLTPELQQEIQGLIKAPAIKKAMLQAKTNALNEGKDIANPAGSLRGLHQTKIALDEQIAAVEAKLLRDGIPSAKNAELNGLKSAKERLLGFIENPQISPDYKIARETYARLSKPVDQLEQIAKLAESSTKNTDFTTYLGKFSNELEKVKKDGLLSKQQIARLQAIKDDLMTQNYADTAGKGVGSNTMQNLAYANAANVIGLPNMLRGTSGGQMVGRAAQKIGNTLYSNANKEITNKMAETMLSPQRAAELMQMPANPALNTNQAQNLARMLMLQQTTQGTQP